MSWTDFLREDLGVAPPWLTSEERLIAEPEIGRAVELLGSIEVIEDRSPVMGEAASFLAKLEHSDRVIVLNGHFLDQAHKAYQAAAREFLVFHELAHLIFGENERLCDCLAVAAVEKRVALRD